MPYSAKADLHKPNRSQELKSDVIGGNRWDPSKFIIQRFGFGLLNFAQHLVVLQGAVSAPHALCTFSKSERGANKGRPPLKDPAAPSSQCSHAKAEQGSSVSACCTYKIKTANSLIHRFNRSRRILPNRFNYGIRRPPHKNVCCVSLYIHCIESNLCLSGEWRSKVSLHRLAQRREPRRIKPFQTPRLSADDFKGPELRQSGGVRRFFADIKRVDSVEFMWL